MPTRKAWIAGSERMNNAAAAAAVAAAAAAVVAGVVVVVVVSSRSSSRWASTICSSSSGGGSRSSSSSSRRRRRRRSRRPPPLPTTLVDISTTRALGGRVGESGDTCVETDLNQSTPKLNAFLQILQLKTRSRSFFCFFWEASQCGSIGPPFWLAFLTVPLEIFDDSVFTLACLGATVQVRLAKQAFEN